MYEVTIYTKSGHVVKVYVKSLILEKRTDGSIASMEWNSCPDGERPTLKRVDLEDVSVIVSERVDE